MAILLPKVQFRGVSCPREMASDLRILVVEEYAEAMMTGELESLEMVSIRFRIGL